MKLSIITINYNDAKGLKKTLDSTLNQICTEFEHCIIDGASTDNSVDVIKEYESKATLKGIKINWISEKDSGIYNAMNKGIKLAIGEYLQFLNSGDALENRNVILTVKKELTNEDTILIGNVVTFENNKRKEHYLKSNISFFKLYSSTLPHTSAFIKHELFEKYGLYDENLKIVSDWKWYLVVVGLNDVSVRFIDSFISIFDVTGISNSNYDLEVLERRKVLEECVPANVLKDYDDKGLHLLQIETLKRHKIFYSLFYILERLIYKIEKKIIK